MRKAVRLEHEREVKERKKKKMAEKKKTFEGSSKAAKKENKRQPQVKVFNKARR